MLEDRYPEGSEVTRFNPAVLPEYKYKSTDPSRLEFRVFCIYPHNGDSASPIQGDLIHTNATEKVEFNWLVSKRGENSEFSLIVVDGCKLRIPSAVEATLRAVRDPETIVSIWIELVCVNVQKISAVSAEMEIAPKIHSLAKGVLEPFRVTPKPDDVAGTVPKLAVMNAPEVAQIYEPLDADSNEIRLICLSSHGGDPESKVQCALLTVPLDGELAYYALSYTWGERDSPATIDLDGLDFNITRNLELALKRLRKDDDDLLIWIDALCINQYNLEERNLQVGRMRDIYHHAAQVMIWLGENDSSQTNEALDNMEMLEERPAEYWNWRYLDSQDQFRKKVPVWGSINLFFTKPWFSRVWVIQEVAVSQSEPLAYCGSRQVSWSRLQAGARHIIRDYPGLMESVTKIPSPDMLSDRTSILRLEHYRSLMRSKKPPSIVDLLIENRVADSADPRDKLYALLGLSSDGQDPALRPDYAKPLSQVYKELFKFIVTRDKRLDIICASQPSGVPTIPCWIPNWFDKWRYSTFGLRPSPSSAGTNAWAAETYSTKTLYNAAGDTEADCYISDGESACFKVRGVPVCPLKRVGTPSYIMHKVPAEWTEMVAQYKDITGKEAPQGFLEDMFWRTLIADPSRIGDRTPSIWQLCHMVWQGKATEESLGLTPKNMATWQQMRERAIHNRTFAVLESGLTGLFPLDAKPDDWVCLLRGCSVPVLLRRKGNIAHFVGDCYVYGLMQGEMLEHFRAQNQEGQPFMNQIFHIH